MAQENSLEKNCGPRSTLTAAGIIMTRHAGVAWRRGKFVRKDRTRKQPEQETQKRRKEVGLWKGPDCNSGIRDRGLRQQVRRRMRIRDLCGRRPLYLRNEGTTSMIYRKAIRLEIVKRALGISSVFRKTRKWILWRGRPPPERKKRSCTE
jgi:hypothetical protein